MEVFTDLIYYREYRGNQKGNQTNVWLLFFCPKSFPCLLIFSKQRSAGCPERRFLTGRRVGGASVLCHDSCCYSKYMNLKIIKSTKTVLRTCKIMLTLLYFLFTFCRINPRYSPRKHQNKDKV